MTTPTKPKRSTAYLSSGQSLTTRLSPEEWVSLFAHASVTPHEHDTTWIPLEDGRTVLIQLRHVVYVDPPTGWKPKPVPRLNRQSQATEQVFGPDFTPE
jgi:hypothetical protein